MRSKKRLKALEEAFTANQGITLTVVFRDFSNGTVSIPSLGFIGSKHEGEKIIKYRCNQDTIVYFNIPRPSHKLHTN
ncbi:hypothetical protein [Alkalihalobacillus sp. CinArs1]|uniref:hypothetical protein n=1 Tax=Alkalihalobacillus sp. CinArs1 TaxID=2995314 RepID=UPI0022DE4286|nr:hypothetical protein [Alkalihalobacillus sp. CinArs1]